MYIYDFYRNYFAPVCLSRAQKSTRQIYDQVIQLWINEVGNSEIHKITPKECEDFVTVSLQKVGAFTVAKYCRCMNALFLRMGTPGWRNRQAFGFVTNSPYCLPPKLQKPLPKLIQDCDIVKLIDALGDIKDYPKCVDEQLRLAWWRTLVLFAFTTAVRRWVIFGLKLPGFCSKFF